jgi:hypothetical protein
MVGYDEDKVDDAVLALFCLTMWNDDGQTRAWKSFAWAVMDRLYQKGYIGNPKTKAKSVAFTAKGKEKARKQFAQLFAKSP